MTDPIPERASSVNPSQVDSELELLRRGIMAADERRKADQLELERRKKQCNEVIADYTTLMGRHQDLKARYDERMRMTALTATDPGPTKAYAEAQDTRPSPALIHIDHSGHANFAIRWATMVAVILVAAIIFCTINPSHIIHTAVPQKESP